jgi:hypothetical protein
VACIDRFSFFVDMFEILVEVCCSLKLFIEST